MQTSTSPQCTMCGKPAPNLCKQCHSSPYCSRACQRADWPVHTLLCRSFSNFKTPPLATSKRGIFFPVDATVPQLVWVKCEWLVDEDDDIRFQSHNKTEFLGDGMTDRVMVQLNKTRTRTRKDLLTLYVREAGSVDGSLLNRCVIAVAGERYVNFAWLGPLLVVRSRGLTLGDSELVDVDMVDFRDAVDLLCSYPNVNIHLTEPEATWEVQGVRINCIGEINLYHRPLFEAVRMPGDHGVFSRPVVGTSRFVGLPVRMLNCSPQKYTKGYDPTNNEAVALLLNCAPKSAIMGSVVIVREDRQPLATQHVEVLCRYIEPLFTECKAGTIMQGKLREWLTKPKFAQYWKEYAALKQAGDESWISIASPV